MATLTIDRATQSEQVSSFFGTPCVAVAQRHGGGKTTHTPVIDPADYDNDTDYLSAIPGMVEKILASANAQEDEWEDVPEKLFHV